MTGTLAEQYTDQLHYCMPPPVIADCGTRWLPTGTTWTCEQCGRRHVVVYIASVGTRWMTSDRPRDPNASIEPPLTVTAPL